MTNCIQSQPCCACAQATDFALIVSNVNDFDDDTQQWTLNNTQIVASQAMIAHPPECVQSAAGAVAGCCPGFFLATNTNITLTTINKILQNKNSPVAGAGLDYYWGGSNTCVTSTLPNTPTALDGTLIKQGNNVLVLQSLNQQTYEGSLTGNFGAVWLVWYWTDTDGNYYGCYVFTTYAQASGGSETYNFSWGSTTVNGTGPVGPFTQ